MKTNAEKCREIHALKCRKRKKNSKMRKVAIVNILSTAWFKSKEAFIEVVCKLKRTQILVDGWVHWRVSEFSFLLLTKETDASILRLKHQEFDDRLAGRAVSLVWDQTHSSSLTETSSLLLPSGNNLGIGSTIFYRWILALVMKNFLYQKKTSQEFANALKLQFWSVMVSVMRSVMESCDMSRVGRLVYFQKSSIFVDSRLLRCIAPVAVCKKSPGFNTQELLCEGAFQQVFLLARKEIYRRHPSITPVWKNSLFIWISLL